MSQDPSRQSLPPFYLLLIPFAHITALLSKPKRLNSKKHLIVRILIRKGQKPNSNQLMSTKKEKKKKTPKGFCPCFKMKSRVQKSCSCRPFPSTSEHTAVILGSPSASRPGYQCPIHPPGTLPPLRHVTAPEPTMAFYWALDCGV